MNNTALKQRGKLRVTVRHSGKRFACSDELAEVARLKTIADAVVRETLAAKLDPALHETIAVRVEFRVRNGTLIGAEYGHAVMQPDNVWGVDVYTMRVGTGRDLQNTLVTVAHEAIHVAQYASGRLNKVAHGWCFCGEFFPEDTPYLERPWELEAFVDSPRLAARATDDASVPMTTKERIEVRRVAAKEAKSVWNRGITIENRAC